MINYAGFWIRFVAYLIDSLVLGAASFILGPFMIVGAWLYFALMESSKYQGTLGKMALGLQVTDVRGKKIGFGRATGRYFAKILSALTLLIGFFMIGWTERKQGLHDIIADCYVVRTK